MVWIMKILERRGICRVGVDGHILPDPGHPYMLRTLNISVVVCFCYIARTFGVVAVRRYLVYRHYLILLISLCRQTLRCVKFFVQRHYIHMVTWNYDMMQCVNLLGMLL